MGKLDALFQRYAANLEQWIPEHRGSFLCPLCFHVIEPQPNLGLVVAEEHIVSEALGGRISTLTCRPCNNQWGAGSESHLVQRVRVEARKRPLIGTIDIEGAVHRAQLHFPESPDQPFRIIGIPKQSDPRQVQAAIQAMTAGATTIKFDMSLGYVPLRSAVALIRSAYLLMFRWFGYRYVLDASAQPIREQLANPSSETPVLRGVSWRLDDNSFGEDTEIGIVVAPLQCFLPILRLCDDPPHVAAVMLPPPGVGMFFYEGFGKDQRHRIARAKMLPLPRGFVPFMHMWHAVMAYCANEKEKTV